MLRRIERVVCDNFFQNIGDLCKRKLDSKIRSAVYRDWTAKKLFNRGIESTECSTAPATSSLTFFQKHFLSYLVISTIQTRFSHVFCNNND